MKGQLVRSILFPKPSKFSFNRDAIYFIGVLAVMAILGTLFSLKDMIRAERDGQMTVGDIVSKCLDLVTITVPPALPTCLSIGISMAMSRL
jgi:cation-transporting ATPase 13A3/4/5